MNESTSHSHGTVLETHHAYTLFGQIAAGGMATIRLAKQVGPHGLSQIVAVKKVHGRWAQDRDVATMFRDEIRVASRVLHPNVVKVLDVMAAKDELLLVVEYVHGESVARLLRARRHAMPVKIACTIMVGVLHGLHAAHEARSERGEPLHIIHRDVTPQNIVVGVDGSARLLDFGIAHALGRIQTTRFGQVKGKLAYMAPEQLRCEPVDRRADIYSAAVTLWEMLAGRKLFNGRNQHELTQMILRHPIEAPGRLRPGLSPELDAIVLRGLQRERQNRYKTARELAIALERETETVSATVLGDWVSQVWGAGRVAREEQLREIENAEGTVYLVRPGSAGGDRVRARTPRETASPRRGTLPREQRHDAKEPSTASTVALARVKQDVAVVAPPRPG
ncbi:MAG TPA: serine/threonine-protein kinase, partial [Polyangia bacterium]|nr:serine/threonine-protein kinase [Polyangia bacterium]